MSRGARHCNGNRCARRRAAGAVIAFALGTASAAVAGDDIVTPPAQRSVEDAIDAADAALAAARAAGNVWLGTPAYLREARTQLRRGDTAAALQAAQRARSEAAAALNQSRLEAARYLLRTSPSGADAALLDVVRGLLRAHDGTGALRLAQQLRTSTP